MMHRLFAFSFLVVGAFAKCQLCINGGAPSNPSAPIAAIGGISCQYFFYNSASVPPNSQECMAVHLSENQALCGCAPVSAITQTPAAAAASLPPLSRADNVTTSEINIVSPAVPVSPAPVVSTSNNCVVCLNGGPPGNPNAIVGDFLCQYYFDNSDYIPPGGQQCIALQLPENQAICGCEGFTQAPIVSLPIVAPPPMAVITQAPIAPPTGAPAAATASPMNNVTGAPDNPPDSSSDLVSSAPSAMPPIDFPTLVAGSQREISAAAEVSNMVTRLCAGAMLVVVTMMVF
jgi:hypothetical protein